ncbi:MAG: imelysin family protein [Cytophagales bacterium]|nr:imelysin family protein [Cytophaga sp.]
MPRYLDLKTTLSIFSTSTAAFTASPSVGSLAAVRIDFLASYKSWEHTSEFFFGPGNINFLDKPHVNMFPTDTVKIKSNILSGVYDFGSTFGPTYSGFPAIEYLLFSRKLTDQQIVDAFIASSSRKTYLMDLIASLKNKTDKTYNGWVSGDMFISSFISNDGVNSGSSTSALLNLFSYDIEVLKNDKIGKAADIVVSMDGTVNTNPVPKPGSAEGYYSDSSLALMKNSILELRDLYLGKSAAGIDGIGFDDYLTGIGKGELNTKILNQFDLSISKINAIPDPYSTAIVNQRAAVVDAYAAITQLLAYIKVDLSSAISVRIDYSDTDGD